MVSHIANELATLQKLLVAAIQAKPNSDVGTAGYVAQSLVISKLLAGKLREARSALDKYYFSGLSRELSGNLPEEAAAALKAITTYFNGENPIFIVRNRAAFHYDADDVPATLAGMPEDLPHVLFAGEESGNSVYYFAEVILTGGLLNALPGHDPQDAFNRLIDDVLKIARTFTTFCEGCIHALLAQAKPNIQGEEIVVDAADTAKLDTQVIRSFVEK